MPSTLQLVLSEARKLRYPEGRPYPDARDILPEDEDPSGSAHLMQSIQKTCAEMSIAVTDDVERVELDDSRYFIGVTAADIVTTIAASTASAAVMVALLKAVREWVAQWLKNRGSRSVDLRIGDRVIKIRGSNDINRAIEALRSVDKAPPRPRHSTKGVAKPRCNKR